MSDEHANHEAHAHHHHDHDGHHEHCDCHEHEHGWKERLEHVGELMREFYVAPYRRTFALARRDEDDLFMLMVFSESLGIPNPVGWYTLEMMPLLYERFHQWHRRMGLAHSPVDGIRCC